MNTVTSADWADEVELAGQPVLVKFGAGWCGPCRALEPQLAAYAKSRPDVKVVSVDVDASPGLAAAHGVQSLPTSIVFKGGREAGRFLGAMPAAKIAAEVARAVA